MTDLEAKMAGTPDGGHGQKPGFLGSLREALAAAGRDEQPQAASAPKPETQPVKPAAQPTAPIAANPPPLPPDRAPAPQPPVSPRKDSAGLSAADAARESRGAPFKPAARHVEADAPPTTRVVRGMRPETGARTQLVRGKANVKRGEFHQDPVVGWVVVVGGPGLGSFRPVFEGNNTIGRSPAQRIPIDFGDDAISSEEQAYIRYDSVDRSFLFVPNLAKTNVVQVNDKKPTTAVPLQAMDVITVGRTQLVFVPFCGADFDWSELSEAKE